MVIRLVKKAENLTDEVSKRGNQREQIVIKITDQGYVTLMEIIIITIMARFLDAIISEAMKDPNYQLKDSDIVTKSRVVGVIKVTEILCFISGDAAHVTTFVQKKRQM